MKKSNKFLYRGTALPRKVEDTKIKPVLIFGYGSLMNRKALPAGVDTVERAILMGYKRCWGKTSTYAYQNIIPTGSNKDVVLGGVVSIDRKSTYTSLRGREAFYDEQDVELFHLHKENRNSTGKAFIMAEEMRLFEHIIAPCLMSYVLTCAQGIMDLFGEEAVEHYLADTVGWPPILDDRKSPKYGRAYYADDLQEAVVKAISKGDFVIASDKIDTAVIPLEEVKKTTKRAKSTHVSGYEDFWLDRWEAAPLSHATGGKEESQLPLQDDDNGVSFSNITVWEMK